MGAIADWISQNWIALIAGIIAVEKILRIIDKLLPDNITLDNDIADFIAKIIKVFAPKKKTD